MQHSPDNKAGKRSRSGLAGEALDSERRFTNAILDAIPDTVYVFDVETGAPVRWNRAMSEVSGHSDEEIAAMQAVVTWYSEEDQVKANAYIQQVLAGHPGRVEIDLIRKDGGTVPTEYSATLLGQGLDDTDRALMVSVGRDISRRRAAEREQQRLTEQLLQSQKMEAVGQLAGGIAHDFNNMLSIIHGNASLALMDLKEGEAFQEEFHEILTAAERARDLTMKLLTFARKEKLNTRQISMEALVSELLQLLGRTLDKKIRMENRVQGGEQIRADKNQILQALINICNNAADAMPDGGVLSFDSQQLHAEGVCEQCGERYSGTYCSLRISDTGVGMPEEIRRKIVEPFFTTKGAGKGTGLGLSVTHGIIVGHQGHMSVQSTPGQGSCFTILLPATGAGAAMVEGEEEQEQLPAGDEVILVVDDEASLLRLANRVLTRAGYQLLLAEGGQQAVELFRSRHRDVALVILDMIMPGMGGAEVFRELKKIAPDVKVILSSGYSADGQAGEMMKQGIQAFVQKPFSIEALCQTIREVLDS